MILSILFQTAPIFIAALGGLFSELSARLNIGLEGAILFGAFAAAISYSIVPMVLPALAVALIAGTLAGLVTAYLSINRNGNVFIVGLGVNLMAYGLIPLLSQWISGSRGVISLNMVNQAQNYAAWVGVVLAVFIALAVISFLKFHTAGLRIRSLYLDEYSASVQGTAVARYQFRSLVISSALSALAGGIICLHLGSYVPNLSAGKGWIALVIVFLGNRKPLPMLAAAIFFAFTQLIANEAQRFLSAPGILIGLPYALTLLALIFYRLFQQSIENRKRQA